MSDEEEFCGLFDEREHPELQRPFHHKCNELEDCADCRYAKYSEITDCIQHFAYELHVGKITMEDSFKDDKKVVREAVREIGEIRKQISRIYTRCSSNPLCLHYDKLFRQAILSLEEASRIVDALAWEIDK